MAKGKEIILADSGVDYNVADHTYHLNGKKLDGITDTLINLAYPKSDTYATVSDEMMNHAAERGTKCHEAVGNLYTVGLPSTGFEEITDKARELLESQSLTPIRFEYVVTDFKHYASPIDIVCVNDKGEICIVDMKFTYKLHYPQVELQTSIYKRFFTLVNPKLKAKHLYVLWIHTSDALNVRECGIYELEPVDDTFLDDLIDCHTSGKQFSIEKYYGTLPSQVASVEDYLVKLQQTIKAKTDEMNNIKAGLCALMEQYNVKQYSSLHLQLTRVTPKPRVTFDSKKFKEEHEDLYNEYIRTSEVKPSVRITIKD